MSIALLTGCADDAPSQPPPSVAAPNAAKQITRFGFPALGDTAAAISEADRTIATTVPFGTDVHHLVATFATTGEQVTVGAVAQVSGTTSNDFSSPVTYTVAAEDGTSQDYTVAVHVAAPRTAKQITRFRLPPGGDATIDETERTIAAPVPFHTDVHHLVATFEAPGATVTVAEVSQVSATTANDFTAPVTYTVTAEDGTSQNYAVSVSVALNAAKQITHFSFPGVGTGVVATINDRAITATLPFGSEPTQLVAAFEAPGASVAIDHVAQVSGTTINDFTRPVTYTVTAEDGTSQDYIVTVSVALNPAKEITSFGFPALAHTVTSIIGTDIGVGVPAGTDLTQLVAAFVTTGIRVTVGGVVQDSGVTSNDFSRPVQYRVIAADGSSVVYTVTVSR